MAKTEYQKIKDAMEKYGEDLIVELIKQIKSADKVATGSLVKSLDYELIEALDTIVVNIKANDYLTNVDKGRKKNKKAPPTSVIRKWIDDKPIQRYRDKRGRFISKQAQAFIIARSIGKKGIKATNVIKKSIERVRKIQAKLVAEAAAEDIQNLVRNVLVNARS